MKRTLYFLLLVLMIASTFGAAEAGTRKKQPKKPATVDMDNAERDRDSDKDRPKRGPNIKKERKTSDEETPVVSKPAPIPVARPIEMQLKRAASKRFDLRALPARRPKERERPEREGPAPNPVEISNDSHIEFPPASIPGVPPTPNPPAPPPNIVFEGLDREFWGAGSPPDTNGDVGPAYYIQSVNTSVGIYDKAGNLQTAFTFDTLMSQGAFGNQCDTENFGDPVVLYDTFEDRWILTDFAFTLDGGGNVNPPIAFQCFAVSMNGNPLTGGWNFYSIAVTDGLNDYPKFGIWTDGIYMSANMFGYAAGGSFITARAWAFNKYQMYAGAPTVQVVAFNVPGGDFTVIPSNARLQTGTPPPGRPNLFISSWQFLNALTVYKFHADWNSISLSTFTGPDAPLAATSWPNAAVANAPQPGTANLLDVLQIRAMVQNQYTNFGGTESLWVPHTVRRANTTGFAAPRWYQVNVTGGTVAAAIPQAATWDPDGANTNHRFMPSLALNRNGDMAMGYSISNSTTMFPSMAYAGRLAADPVNTFGQTETFMFTGTASQTTSTRWGDYSSMTLDPDGCTFWYTSEYANPLDQTAAKRWKTKIGSFTFPGCTTFTTGGTVTGTVTETPGGTPISGATITFGTRSTTTNGSGVYSFLNIPAGTYPSISATKPGYSTASASSIVVTDGGTTIQDFALSLAPTSACLTDTTQADFQTGVGTNVDVTTSPGDVTLSNTPTSDQANTAGTTTGTGFGTPNWTGQTFIAGVTGQLAKADIRLFCSGCGATPPNLTLSVRNTAAGLPTGADLASVSIPGSAFASGGTVLFTATFGAPATLNSGTQYALILRPVAAPAGSGYFWIRSSPSTYASGSRVLSADSGGTWSTDTTRDYNFRTYMQTGYAPSGNLVSGNKDSNPLAPLTPIWSTLSWNGVTPANTTLQFQVAGSNNPGGPFNFVGPDGTAGTFYTTSPGSLTPLYNLRYAKYKAYLATTNSAVTPALNDATMCFNNVDCTAPITITPTPALVCPNSTGNTASGPAGATSYSWSITNGTITSATNIQTITYTAGASGNVALTLNIVEAGGCQKSANTNVPIDTPPAQPTISGNTSFCTGGSTTLTSSSATGNQWFLNGNPIGGETGQQYVATAAGDYTVQVTNGNGCVSAMSAITTVTVNPIPSAPTITPGGPTTFCTGGSVTLTSSVASGNQWYLDGNPIGGETNQNYVATASGSYTVTQTVTGCESPQSTAVVVTVNPLPATPTITPGGPTTFCQGGSVTLTSSSASGNQWFLNGNPIGGETNQNYVATASGDYTVQVTDGNGCVSAMSSTTTVTVNPIPSAPTITPGGPTTFCTGGSVTLTSSSTSGNQWYLNGNPIGGETGQQYIATASGSYTVTETVSGCESPQSSAVVVTVNPLPATPTITPGGPTTFCQGGSVTLTSSSASGNQWFLNGNPIGGETNQNYVATASGNYAVQVTDGNGCVSAMSSTTTVTVNPIPSAPTITPGGPTTFCQGGSVTLTSSVAIGNQWYLNGNPIGGETNQNYIATASGSYTVTQTVSGCESAQANAVVVTVNPLPATPTITPGGPTTFCTGGSVTLTSSSASGNQWFLNGNPIGGETNQNYVATASGNYTVQVTDGNGCVSAASAPTTVTVNPIPSTPTITPGGPTTFCQGGSVTLTSSSATGNQWYLNGNPIGGATGQQYIATASGNYTVVVTASGCSSAPSSATTVTVNPIPATPTITPSGPTTFCQGGSVTLTSSSASGNQWYLNGNPIGGATAQQYIASVAGDYTVVVTTNGCSSAASATTTVTVNPNPDATITAPASVVSGSTGNAASVASAGAGATYAWSITNGTITAGNNTPNITFTAGAAGTLTLQVTVTTAAGCSDTKSANVNVTALPTVTVTSVIPPAGKTTGGKNVTINGSGFQSGATIKFDTSFATNVVFVNSTKLTAKTPAHAAGFVNVTVTNPDTSSGTLTNGYKYVSQQFDANGDNIVDPSDIFYLVNYLFLSGPAPAGAAGMDSGDANGDGVVDPADIFYIVNYLFLSGPAPAAGAPGGARSEAVDAEVISGAITLGKPFLRGDRYVVPVSVSAAPRSTTPQAMSLRVVFDGAVRNAAVHRAGDVRSIDPAFEISRSTSDSLVYLLAFDEKKAGLGGVVAEIEIESDNAQFSIAIDPALTMLSNQSGTKKATVSGGTLRISGASAKPQPQEPKGSERKPE